MADLSFIDNPAVKNDPQGYEAVILDVRTALESLRLSMLSYEIMHQDGTLKADEVLSEKQQARRAVIREMMSKNEPLPKPIIGLGLMDNVEIGSERDVFLTLAIQGAKTIPVHVRKSQIKALKKFIVG
ncbi:MAG: hypothetical protein CMH30_01135 [Micavibrio sp.]|nr:hypothetical protein [Micavibrio sp.]|tara:strand:+ start:8603 stop:8986 length:384 start_codon:yes stop_codon:yes gene_type:complete